MHQHRLWTDPKVIAERRAKVEAYMGRKLELPGDVKPAKEHRQGKAA
jgi:hypothetical protein